MDTTNEKAPPADEGERGGWRRVVAVALLVVASIGFGVAIGYQWGAINGQVDRNDMIEQQRAVMQRLVNGEDPLRDQRRD